MSREESLIDQKKTILKKLEKLIAKSYAGSSLIRDTEVEDVIRVLKEDIEISKKGMVK